MGLDAYRRIYTPRPGLPRQVWVEGRRSNRSAASRGIVTSGENAVSKFISGFRSAQARFTKTNSRGNTSLRVSFNCKNPEKCQKEAKILNVEETARSISMTLDTVLGRQILVFDKKLNELVQWVVVDEKSRRTTVALDKLVAGVGVDPALFKINVKRSTPQGKKSDR